MAKKYTYLPRHVPSQPQNYKIIPLQNGLEALVSNEDYEKSLPFVWFAMEDGNTYYVRANCRIDGKRSMICLHALILGANADHRDGNGLDNRRSNLRPATKSQNGANRKMQKNNSSGYRGVTRNSSGSWLAQIQFQGKKMHLGSYPSPELAYEVYKAKAIELFGEYFHG